MTSVIFLGAGTSAAEEAPMQGQLFHWYFAGDGLLSPVGMQEHLTLFFAKLFKLDITTLKEGDEFPTFEEALGILDLAELRHESLHGLRGEDGLADIALTRQYLIFAMALVIARDLGGSSERHEPQKPHL